MLERKEWLPHLTNEMMVGARNQNFCSYLIALEGWRRGLTLKFYSDKVTKKNIHAPGRLFSLSSEKSTHVFYKSRGDRVKGKAFSIGSNKYATKEWLAQNGVPVVEGKKFDKSVENLEIVSYAKQLGFPVVLKPVVGAKGKGVIANINDEAFLKESLSYVREKLKYPEIIVERYFEGEEYRLYVIENEVVAVLNRRPANIIGDGVHTIKELINQKNKERKKNPRLYSCLIKVDFEIENNLKKLGFTLESIPENGKQIYLREKSNVSSGGDSIAVTDEFPVEIKNIAIKALQTIPDFPHGGVDIIFNQNKPVDEAAVVIELSPTPQIGSLVFPMIGKSKDVPAAIVDYYFPETKERKNFNPAVYFDFNGVLEPLQSKSASEVTVTPAPIIPIFSKKYTISGKVQGVGYRKWIRTRALESDLNGYTQNLNNGTVIVVVSGDQDAVNKFEATCSRGPKACKVTSISEEIWTKPVKIGFEIKSNPKVKKSAKTTQTDVKKSSSFQMLKRKVKRILQIK